jgi:hypothetical protein
MRKAAKKDLGALRKQKERLLRQLQIPPDALPGSLSVSRLRCGKANCHCKEGEGHENWTLTYMSEGEKRVKHIAEDLVPYVHKMVKKGKAFKEGLNDIFVANAELLVLLRKQKQRT